MMRRTRIVVLSGVLMLLALVMPAHAALILNEALANEPGSATTLEWVEILNWPDTGQTISLSGYKYIDGGQSVTLDTNILIPAGGFAILTRKATGASSYEEHWGNASGVWGDHESESYLLVSVSEISLRNSSDTISIVSPMADTSTILWLTGTGDGISFERIRPGSNDAPSNFSICKDSTGSTPGRGNSILPLLYDLRVDSVAFTPPLPNAGESVTFLVVIENTGYGAVDSAQLTLWLDLSLALAKVNVPRVEEGATVEIEATWSTIRPGVNHLSVSLPPDGESSDNWHEFPVVARFVEPSIIISEYLSNPEVGGPEEWVEITNVTEHPISLESILIGDSINLEPIPLQSRLLRPGAFWILTENPIAFDLFYPSFQGTTIGILGWRALNNTGDGIRLIGPSGEIIDSLTFRTTYPGNRSIERVELSPTFARPEDWAGSEDESGATPGQPNSVQRGEPGSLTLDSVWLAPPAPSWGDTIRIFAAVSNNSFGPASNWSLLASRDLDFSAPGASLSEIGETAIPTTDEGQEAVINVVWDSAAPGIHRVHVALRDESNQAISSSAIFTTVQFSQPLLIVSEYMAAPLSPGPGEWIELYNASQLSISLQGIRFGNSEGDGVIIPPPPVIMPGAFLVIAEDEVRFRAFYSGFSADIIALSDWRSLNDGGDIIRILGTANEIIDSVTFGTLTRQSRSIERRQLTSEFADPRDWGESFGQWDATPGEPNSIRRYANDMSIDSVVLDFESVTWPSPVTGSVFVSNIGFNDDTGLFVSVLSPGHGEIARITTSDPVESRQTVVLPFEFQAPRIGHNAFSFLLTEDDFGNNNYQFAAVSVATSFPAIIISEYLADPVQPGPGEWIELYNASTIDVSLYRYAMGDSSAFSFIPYTSARALPPNSFVVLCVDREQFRSWYPSFSGELIQLNPWRELNNSEDKIRLRGETGEIVDSLSYHKVYGDNVANERLTLSPTFSSPSDWTRSVDPSGGTPGRPNSVSAASAGSLQVDVSPNPIFRSAGQSARIDYRLEIGESLTLKIYDRAGRLVRTIADESPSATGFVEWNGADDDGYELRPGPYVLLARSEPAGSMKKLVVVIAP